MSWLTRLQDRPLDASALLVLAMTATDDDQRLAAQDEPPPGERDHAAWMARRVVATQRIEDEKFLKRLAIYGPEKVRWAAINNPRLTDQEFLARLVEEEPDEYSGAQALDKIDKPDLIRRLAHAPQHHWRVRSGLAQKLQDLGMVDDMTRALQDPKHPLHDQGDRFIDHIDDPEVLNGAARSAEPGIRFGAVNKLNSPEPWIRFIGDLLDESIVGMGLSKWVDESLDYDGSEARNLVDHMTPTQLDKMLDDGYLRGLQAPAVRRTTDRTRLAKFLNSDSSDVVWTAVEKLKDEPQLLRRTLERVGQYGDFDDWQYVVEKLLKLLDDPAQWLKFADYGSADVRHLVALHVDDQGVAKMWRDEGSRRDGDRKVLQTLIGRMTDPVLLTKVALTNDEYGFVALNRLDPRYLDDKEFAHHYIAHAKKLKSRPQFVNPRVLPALLKYATGDEKTMLVKLFPRRSLDDDTAAKIPHQAPFEKPARDRQGQPAGRSAPVAPPRPQLLRLLLRLSKP